MEKLSMWELRDDQICFVNIKNEYLEYLNRNGDSRVPVEHSEQGRRKRPYIGILLTGSLGMDYVLPLTSPKPKHQRMRSSLDFHRLDSGKLGAVNINDMIPVLDDSDYTVIDLDGMLRRHLNTADRKYYYLLEKQRTWIEKNDQCRVLQQKAGKLHEKYCNGSLNRHIASRCVDFPKVEAAAKQYNKRFLDAELDLDLRAEEEIEK